MGYCALGFAPKYPAHKAFEFKYQMWALEALSKDTIRVLADDKRPVYQKRSLRFHFSLAPRTLFICRSPRRSARLQWPLAPILIVNNGQEQSWRWITNYHSGLDPDIMAPSPHYAVWKGKTALNLNDISGVCGRWGQTCRLCPNFTNRKELILASLAVYCRGLMGFMRNDEVRGKDARFITF